MAHGAGGKASRALVEGLVVPLLDNPALAQLSDAALVSVGGRRVAFTTDAFVVSPIRFPGGSIGELAVNGTVNDLAVSGARPVALSAALVLEEGLATDVLRAEVEAMASAARRAGVPVVAGDTKVVQRGRCDSMYIVTTGIGEVVDGAELAAVLVRPGDKVLVSGTIGDHGVAILLARGDLDIEADVRSDTQPLWPLAERLIEACGDGLHCMRDATGRRWRNRPERDRPRRRGRCRHRRGPVATASRGRRCRRAARHRPALRRQRGQARRLRRA